MKVGLVCRFKPLHRVHEALLEAVCAVADEALIGVGSANRYDLDNPFTFDESASWVEAVVGPRWPRARWIPIPDLGDGPRWRELVVRRFGALDLFVSANPYVRQLLGGVYALAHPRELVPPERHAPLSGEVVRLALARGEPWEHLVPPAVAEHMRRERLPERFRREFGLATLARVLRPLRPGAPQPGTAPNTSTAVDASSADEGSHTERRDHVLLG